MLNLKTGEILSRGRGPVHFWHCLLTAPKENIPVTLLTNIIFPKATDFHVSLYPAKSE